MRQAGTPRRSAVNLSSLTYHRGDVRILHNFSSLKRKFITFVSEAEMNIFETIYECNINHPSKLALSVTMDDGSTRAYTYGGIRRQALVIGS